MRLSSFFWHCETDFFPNFFYCSSHQFLIFCNRLDVQKIPKRPPFYIFWHYATYRKLQKNSKKIGSFFSIFILRAFVVSSCRKSGFRFRVFLSLRYRADLGRSRFVIFLKTSVFSCDFQNLFLPKPLLNFYEKRNVLRALRTPDSSRFSALCDLPETIKKFSKIFPLNF